MSRFLEFFRKENERIKEDQYTEEERLRSQQQYAELWAVLAKEPGDPNNLLRYIDKWTKKEWMSNECDDNDDNDDNVQLDSLTSAKDVVTNSVIDLLFDSVGPGGLKPLHWYFYSAIARTLRDMCSLFAGAVCKDSTPR